MKERTSFSPILIFFLLITIASIGFGQETQSMSLGLIKWQDASPIQVVGVTSGNKSVIDEVYLFNTSDVAIESFKFGALLVGTQSDASHLQFTSPVVVSDRITVSIPAKTVIRLTKLGLWTSQDVRQLLPSGFVASLTLKIGIESSRFADGLFFDSELTAEKSFRITRANTLSNDYFDKTWAETGSQQLAKLANESLIVDTDSKLVGLSQIKKTGQQDCTSLASQCNNNVDPADTSWCRQDTQTTCSTFQCDLTKPCPKKSCGTVLELAGTNETKPKKVKQ